jgi:putative acetyltransferase
MNYKIEEIPKSEYKNVVDVWEVSVRATHHFLQEEDIQFFKPLILNNYLDAVTLRCVKSDTNEIIAFFGVAENNLEMLFIHPNYRGKKIGKSLLDFAIAKFAVTKVDVNEQNEQAVGFYLYYGFEIISRSETDSFGKPYPILHMELNKKAKLN